MLFNIVTKTQIWSECRRILKDGEHCIVEEEMDNLECCAEKWSDEPVNMEIMLIEHRPDPSMAVDSHFCVDI